MGLKFILPRMEWAYFSHGPKFEWPDNTFNTIFQKNVGADCTRYIYETVKLSWSLVHDAEVQGALVKDATLPNATLRGGKGQDAVAPVLRIRIRIRIRRIHMFLASWIRIRIY
jgi:hypothetical protein